MVGVLALYYSLLRLLVVYLLDIMLLGIHNFLPPLWILWAKICLSSYLLLLVRAFVGVLRDNRSLPLTSSPILLLFLFFLRQKDIKTCIQILICIRGLYMWLKFWSYLVLWLAIIFILFEFLLSFIFILFLLLLAFSWS